MVRHGCGRRRRPKGQDEQAHGEGVVHKRDVAEHMGILKASSEGVARINRAPCCTAAPLRATGLLADNSAAARQERRVTVVSREGAFVSVNVLIVILVWAGASLAVAGAGGLFRARRLPPTRHERRGRPADPGF
jgi:hypothetical protein